MTSQQAKFVSGIRERFFPEVKTVVDLFCEVIWVLQSDELNGAAAKREGRGESRGVFFRELVRQPVEQVFPQGFCQAHVQHRASGLCPGAGVHLTLLTCAQDI